MKRSSRAPFARLAVVAVIAMVIGVFAPVFSEGQQASAATDGQMIYPASGNIQSKVGDGCRNNYRAHDGIDISNQGGTPILAAYDGVIKTRTANSGYGNYVDIEHPGGYVTRYGHMASPGMQAPGTRVTRGQQIGVVGMTGATSALHLHFEVWRNGSVYAAINNGFTCLANISRGATIPMTFPGLSTAPTTTPTLTSDFNRDVFPDLLGVGADGDLKFIGGTAGGVFQPPTIVTSGWGTRLHLSHVDFNADGHSDLLAVRSDGVLEFYAGTGAVGGGFDGFETVGVGWSSFIHVVSGADYTGDGRHDVLGVWPGGTMTIYPGNGAGGFASSSISGGGGWDTMKHLVGGDFNNDRTGDLIGVDNAGTLWFYPGVPGGFGARQSVGTGWAGFTALTGGIDYNRDGRHDLIARTAGGDLMFYPGLGTGSFGSAVLAGTGFGDYAMLE